LKEWPLHAPVSKPDMDRPSIDHERARAAPDAPDHSAARGHATWLSGGAATGRATSTLNLARAYLDLAARAVPQEVDEVARLREALAEVVWPIFDEECAHGERCHEAGDWRETEAHHPECPLAKAAALLTSASTREPSPEPASPPESTAEASGRVIPESRLLLLLDEDDTAEPAPAPVETPEQARERREQVARDLGWCFTEHHGPAWHNLLADGNDIVKAMAAEARHLKREPVRPTETEDARERSGWHATRDERDRETSVYFGAVGRAFVWLSIDEGGDTCTVLRSDRMAGTPPTAVETNMAGLGPALFDALNWLSFAEARHLKGESDV
jgi:hypothetical protein